MRASRTTVLVATAALLAAGCGAGEAKAPTAPAYCPSGPAAATSDPTLIIPGVGVGSVALGKSTADDILRAYGCDARIDWDQHRKILDVSYEFDPAGNVAKPIASRPSAFWFIEGEGVGTTVTEIRIGPEATRLHTAKGNTVASTYDAFVAEFGEPVETVPPEKDDSEKITVSTFAGGLRVRHRAGSPSSIKGMMMNTKPVAVPVTVAKGDGWEISAPAGWKVKFNALWFAEGTADSLSTSVFPVDAGPSDLAAAVKSLAGRAVIQGTPTETTISGVKALEIETVTSFGKGPSPRDDIHARSVVVITATNRIFEVRCGNSDSMKGPADLARWEKNRNQCDAIFKAVVLK